MLTERAYELICAINLCRNSNADLGPAMVRSIVQFSEYVPDVPPDSRGSYLHSLDSMNIVHGDLRGTNISLADEGNACFGLARVIDVVASDTSGAFGTSSNHAGSVRWFAPTRRSSAAKNSCGRPRAMCTHLLAFVLSHPFSDVPQDTTAVLKVRDEERPGRPTIISDNLWELVTAAWAQTSKLHPQT
ncbi:hypothetical protein C8R47DRAFT_1138833 [Mycena vitilis]|nr:hypothetical protein C8R47DRAFT_1138833 [Mycena vitilis]